MKKARSVNLLKSAFSISALTILCRTTGYFRDLLMANFIGVNKVSDALALAIRFPAFFRRVFAEGAFHVSFLPIFTKMLKENGSKKSEAFVFAGTVFTILLVSLSVCVLLIEYFIPSISSVLFSKLAVKQPETFALFVKFARITLPYVLFISIASFFGSILNSFGKFNEYAASQIIGNTTVIVFVYLFFNYSKDFGSLFAWAVLVSGAIQLIWIIGACWYQGYLFPLNRPKKNPLLKKFFINIGPGALGVGVAQINTVLASYFATHLPEGSVSYLSYADRLNQFPLSIIGASLSSVLLPLIAQNFRKNQISEAYKVQSQSIRLASFITFPVAIFFMVAAPATISVLFGYGKLVAKDISAISQTLIAYGWGIPAYVLIKIFNTTFFAAGDTKTPLIGGIVNLGINIVLSIILMRYFSYMGIALAASFSAWGSVIFLMVCLQSRGLWRFHKHFMKFVLRLGISCIVMGGFLTLIYPFFSHIENGLLYFFQGAFLSYLKFIPRGIAFIFLLVISFSVFVFTSMYMRVFSLRQLRVIKRSFISKKHAEDIELTASSSAKG